VDNQQDRQSNLTDEFQFERMYRRPFDARLPIPHDLFRVGERDPLIRTYIDAWRGGHCSWEAALVGMICALHQAKEKLMENVVMVLDHSCRSFIVPGPGNCRGGEGEAHARRVIETRGMKLLAEHGRTLVVDKHPNFLCERWYNWIVVAVNHDKLAELITEGKQPLKT